MVPTWFLGAKLRVGDLLMVTPKKPSNIDDYRKEKAKKEIKERFFDELEKVRELNAHADERFLAAWKQGVKLLGTQFFDVKGNVDETTEKWQLAPNIVFINETIDGYSHGQQVLLGLMCSFYNSEDGQEILEKAGAANLVDALGIIDLKGREIIAELWLNYTGW